MKKYNVLIPCTMAIAVIIEAENEEEAKGKAFQVDFNMKIESDDPAEPEIVEFETHDRISYGNVYCGCICDMGIEEID